MKLATAAIKAIFDKTPIYTHDGKPPGEVPVICKIFSPVGRFTYYVTEAEKQGEDYFLFGFCVSALGQDCDELGYACLGEFERAKLPMGLTMERDLH